jgi:16S rRNA C967 or C1407 C5-methylase (RsmB/RsmF family)
MVELPDDFITQTRSVLGDERFARFLAAFNEEAPVSIRINDSRVKSAELRAEDRVPWCPLGFYLPTRPAFTFDPLLHAGCYYVQEAASMFIHHVLNSTLHSAPLTISSLDLCAAPGGKSTCMLGVLPPGSRLWSNEPVRQRASILSENIQKWGHPGCIVTNNYPEDYVRSGLMFDIILCDVPCSGEGMFRRDPQTIGEWSLQAVEKCRHLQRDIVSDAWQCLNPGGLLVYSTCTLNTKENEENARWIRDTFDADIVDVGIRPEWGITGSLLPGFHAPVYRFIPGITRSEGLFVCVFRKKGGEQRHAKRQRQTLNVIYDSSEPRQEAVGSVELSYADAISYLQRQALHLPPDAPRGLVEVTFEGHRLGLVKNIGPRANNLYPKEWAIRSTHAPKEYQPIIQNIVTPKEPQL